MTPPSQPTESPFLCLPQEVRQRIYKFLFTSRGTVHIDHLKRKRPSDGARQAAVPVSPQPVGFPLLSRAEQIQRVEDAVLGMHKVTSMWQYMHDLVQYHEIHLEATPVLFQTVVFDCSTLSSDRLVNNDTEIGNPDDIDNSHDSGLDPRALEYVLTHLSSHRRCSRFIIALHSTVFPARIARLKLDWNQLSYFAQSLKDPDKLDAMSYLRWIQTYPLDFYLVARTKGKPRPETRAIVQQFLQSAIDITERHPRLKVVMQKKVVANASEHNSSRKSSAVSPRVDQIWWAFVTVSEAERLEKVYKEDMAITCGLPLNLKKELAVYS
ncbi:hypothetical protein RBB50_006993 [Rhinocladiella similis]